MEIRELTSPRERRAAVPILRQLWTGRTAEEIFEWTSADGYRLFGGFVDGELVGVAGVVVQDFLHHRKHAWLYDLVVDQPHRQQGYGSTLVEFVEAWADDRACACVALASPMGKQVVHDFYDARDYEKWGYVIEKRL